VHDSVLGGELDTQFLNPQKGLRRAHE